MSFCSAKGVILGHIFSNKGIEVDKAKEDVIKKSQPPIFVKDMRSFLRHVDFYRWFIKDFSKITKPLT